MTLNSITDYFPLNQSKYFYFYEGGKENGKEIDYKCTKTLKTMFQDKEVIFLFTLTNNSDRLSGLYTLTEKAPMGMEIFHLNYNRRMKSYLKK